VKELAEHLSQATTVEAFANAVATATARAVGFGSFDFTFMTPRVAERPYMLVRSNEFPLELIVDRIPGILLSVERELGGLMWALSEPQAFRGYLKWASRGIEKTVLRQEYWRPLKVDRQVIAPLWFEGAPGGYFHLCRSSQEPDFTAEDLRWCEEARLVAERALRGIASLGQGQLSNTLANLSACFPHPAYLFGPNAELRWMSDEGVVRLSLEAARLGGGHLIRGNAALTLLSEQVRSAFASRVHDLERPLKRARLLRPGERVATRRFSEYGSTSLLVAFVPAMAAFPGPKEDSAPDGRLPGLGAVESKVARLAADGYTVLNIAAQLGVTEATVRTHLRRVYVKLGVHGRAELARVLHVGT
jgi:DNA-binding CsgD family transcriptional regulator